MTYCKDFFEYTFRDVRDVYLPWDTKGWKSRQTYEIRVDSLGDRGSAQGFLSIVSIKDGLALVPI